MLRMLKIQDFSANMLAGKTALVTGAARGIGLAIGHRLSELGARVILTDCDQIGVSAAAQTLVRVGKPLPCTSTSPTRRRPANVRGR